MWWQQDGAPSHTSNAIMQYLRAQFSLRLMSKCGDSPWTPRSPDLAMCDFFLWGYLKQHIWNVPQNFKELQNSIITACRNLEQQMIQAAFNAMVSRARTNK